MENNQTMEQPLDVGVQVEVNEPIEIEKDNFTTNNNSSSFGKFKDATSLLNAYENLEKEFTRKSQKLSALLKENTTNETKTTDTKNLEQEVKITEVYKQKDWHTNVSSFFNTVPNAREYAKEISKILIEDKELAKNKNCLQYAFAKALAESEKVKPANSLDNPEYFEQIVNNEKVKAKIINDYLLKINSNKNNLHIISGEPNSISLVQKTEKPKNLQEASQIFKKLLQS